MEIDFSECEPSQAWLSRLNNNPDFLKEALDSWRLWSHRLLQEIKVATFTRAKSSVYETEGQLPAFEFPDAFNRLTDLIVMWCDTARTGINGDPLLHYRDMAELCSLDPWSQESFGELRIAFLPCQRLLRRIELVATLGSGEQPATTVREHKPATVAPEGQIGASDIDRNAEDGQDVDAEKKGAYGLYVNCGKRRIRREGCNKSVSLENHPNLWHIFHVLFLAKDKQASLEELENDYPGEWNASARNFAYSDLRSKLKPLGMTVCARRLMPIEQV